MQKSKKQKLDQQNELSYKVNTVMDLLWTIPVTADNLQFSSEWRTKWLNKIPLTKRGLGPDRNGRH